MIRCMFWLGIFKARRVYILFYSRSQGGKLILTPVSFSLLASWCPARSASVYWYTMQFIVSDMRVYLKGQEKLQRWTSHMIQFVCFYTKSIHRITVSAIPPRQPLSRLIKSKLYLKQVTCWVSQKRIGHTHTSPWFTGVLGSGPSPGWLYRDTSW
jgi:hypothetical protein